MVYEEEWRELSRVFKIDREIEVRRHFEGPDVLTSDPKVCDNCVRDRFRKEVRVVAILLLSSLKVCKRVSRVVI